ncbi:SRPBCC family protein [Echinicola shivajiensis]|uniref:hypothetical protein n=1 Tax=Echinicola shivajiensis TaxID=1035916 RepID=UPI001BFC644C|nr:hypothetical protein [Echinicola shivajiensis]
MFIFYLLIILFSWPQNTDWKLEKDKNGIKVFTRKLDGYPIRQFSVETQVKAQIKDLDSLFRKIKNYPNWMADIEKVDEIKQLDENTYQYYLILDSPFPSSNRDLMVEIKFLYPQKDILRLEIKDLKHLKAHQKGLVRIEDLEGFWQFEILDNDSLLIKNQFISDPGGNIPSWITNQFLIQNPFETTQSLIKQLE